MLAGTDRWCVVNADWTQLALPKQEFDHAITDPPYDARTHSRARSLKGGGSDIDIDIDFDVLDVGVAAPAMLQLAKRWFLAFCSLEMLGSYREALGDAHLRSGIWDRPDGTPQISGDRPGQAAEGISVAHGPTQKRWNRGGKRGMWRCGVERQDRSGHPTQKPLGLMLEFDLRLHGPRRRHPRSVRWVRNDGRGGPAAWSSRRPDREEGTVRGLLP